jgi:hypothetical protein
MSFAGSQCTKFRQIGNSVPPALGQVVGRVWRGLLTTDEAGVDVELVAFVLVHLVVVASRCDAL